MSIVWAAVAVFLVLPTVVCALKGRWGAAVFGALVVGGGWYAALTGRLAEEGGYMSASFIGFLAAIALIAVAMEYADPGSLWARLFYDDEKKRKAAHRRPDVDRFGERREARALRNFGPARWGRDGE
jgi:hypothetical protein